MARKFYNADHDLLVVIHADGRTAILGNNPDKVDDQEILDMYNGELPSGWKVAP